MLPVKPYFIIKRNGQGGIQKIGLSDNVGGIRINKKFASILACCLPYVNIISYAVCSGCCVIIGNPTYFHSVIFSFLRQHFLKIIIPAFVVNLICTIYIQKRQNRIKYLEKEIQENKITTQQYEYAIAVFTDLCKEIACEVYKSCNLSVKERVTIYLHNGCAFLSIGRYSQNPKFCKIGRSFYPDNQGCISRAWEEDSFEVKGLPYYSDNPEEYFNHQAKYGLSRETVEAFEMKSRYYAGYAIYDSEKQRKIAVIIVESTKSRSKNGLLRSLVRVIDSGIGDKLRTLLGNSLRPDVQFAKGRGF